MHELLFLASMRYIDFSFFYQGLIKEVVVLLVVVAFIYTILLVVGTGCKYIIEWTIKAFAAYKLRQGLSDHGLFNNFGHPIF